MPSIDLKGIQNVQTKTPTYVYTEIVRHNHAKIKIHRY